ncbi:TIGR01777 family protein [Gordonia iterans]|uniref:TIGR01777 family protein n=1 Tax=Gordonia iterans TaxID=1004901 RepID=A0A2S0KH75_9ACTN|nr:TIGR01777 family oxidoreductase [Gordonia iterans]AVM01045.1 TIGR01777 family protein [Gordonia iterans]
MRIAVAGSHGLIGSALAESLARSGHDVVRLVRSTVTGPDQVRWDPEGYGIPPGTFDGVDAVVGLGGLGLGNRRWSGWVKQQLRDSRIVPTAVLAEAVHEAGVPVFLSASATGFYGDTGDDAATEETGPGDGFLADLTVDWEAAALPAVGARVVHLRTAPVLSRRGGLLGRLRPLYKLGAGGPIGDGRQFFSWITLADEIAAIRHVLDDDSLSGPVNLSAPQQVRYSEFSDQLARALHRRSLVKVPARVAKAVGGELVEELILASSRVEPKLLLSRGFTFAHPTLPAALEYARA